MIKKVLILAGICMFCFALQVLRDNSWLGCEGTENSDNSQVRNIKKKSAPNDWAFRQRAYPSGTIDSEAYLKASRYRKSLLTKKNNSISKGLDDPNWQFVGPTNIGGRITDIEIDGQNTHIIYVGAASGGIFKSIDSGSSWAPIFDEELNLSIGDMAISESDQRMIYAGTGEPNAGGGSLAYDGSGVYRSQDGGDHWAHLGLENTGSTGKILVHPSDPEVCYVGAMGKLFKNNSERGVYKTTDGGQTWQNKLFLNDSTGVIDMAMHPYHPDTIYAATWQRVRRVNRRSYGGNSSGIYRSYDGGESWIELTTGLPTQAGRIGIAISRSDPDILYTFYVNESTGYIKGLFKTLDRGDTWQSISKNGISDVPYMWWFGKITVDPVDPEIVYLMGLNMHKSTNGGNSWTGIFPGAHVDQHALCINPANQDMLIAGNDGGIYISHDGGQTHVKSNTLPITQYYTCEIDYLKPDNIYGGTQDNGTSRTLTGQTDDFEIIFGGDGFRVLVDPQDNRYIYAESQYGGLGRSVDGGNVFFSATNGISFSDRYNWNTPVVFDPQNSSTLYLGTNRLYRSTNRAISWDPISPDLSGNPPQNNLVFGTITTISISPLDEKIIYAGTDDGQLQLTFDGGISWNLVSMGLPDRWVTSIACSPENVNMAFVTLSGFRYGSNAGHVFKTIDNGVNWLDISGNLPDIPVNDLIVIPANNDLFVATDIGVFHSPDQGSTWSLYGNGLPNVVITDIDYHEDENILLCASYGRGLYKTYPDLEPAFSQDINKPKNFKIQAFPNPFTSHLTLDISTQKSDYYTISLLDMAGLNIKELYRGFIASGNTEMPIDLTNLAPGMYVCRLARQSSPVYHSIKLIRI